MFIFIFYFSTLFSLCIVYLLLLTHLVSSTSKIFFVSLQIRECLYDMIVFQMPQLSCLVARYQLRYATATILVYTLNFRHIASNNLIKQMLQSAKGMVQGQIEISRIPKPMTFYRLCQNTFVAELGQAQPRQVIGFFKEL